MGRGASASHVNDKENMARSKLHNTAPTTTRPAVSSRPLYKPVAPRFLNAHANPRAAAAAAAAAASTSSSPPSSIASLTSASSTSFTISKKHPSSHLVSKSSTLPGQSANGPAGSISPTDSGCDDADWERAMDARLAQWRYMNLVAVAELQAEEREACTEIDRLATQLEETMDEVARLTARLDAARATAAGATFADRARPCLELLAQSLAAMRPEHARICAALVESLESLPTRNIIADPGAASALAREIARFRVAAVDFATAAAEKGANENCAIALEDLARCVAEEAPGVRKVLCTTVRDAALVMEQDVSVRAADVSRRRKTKRSTSSGSSTSTLSSGLLSSGFGSGQRLRRRTSVTSG